jgi:kynurenine formamidase
MSVLQQLLEGIGRGGVEVIDLTAPLSEATPVIRLPEPFADTPGFSLRELSRYDERGPAWYWNAISAGEHVGTHFDAPIHWVTGRDGLDVSQVPPRQLVAPAVVIDKTADCAVDPDFLLDVDHVRDWEADHGPLPEGGWLLYRSGWDARASDQESFLNADESGPHTPGLSVECARWLAEETAILGIGVETVGTDAGRAHAFDPPFPCHAFFLGNGKYGLTQLAHLDRLPATGSVIIAAPLPIEGGSGSPSRVLALVEAAASG